MVKEFEISKQVPVNAIVYLFDGHKDWVEKFTFATNEEAATHLGNMECVMGLRLEKIFQFKKFSYMYPNNKGYLRVMRYLLDIDRMIAREKLNKIANAKATE